MSTTFLPEQLLADDPQTKQPSKPAAKTPVATAEALLLQMYVSAETFRLSEFLDSLSR